MALFVTPQRLFFQIGIVDLKYFPTIPMIYYAQLAFYAPYELLRLLGMPDFQFYSHTSLIVEGFFLKLPSVLCDAGIFLVLLNYTRKLVPSALFFLNPLPICLSAVWGTYDSTMLFPLILGFFIFETHSSRPKATVMFVVAGLFKLFGFVTFALAICHSIIHGRIRNELLLEVFGGTATIVIAIAPLIFFGGYQSFLQVIVYRFVGYSTGMGGTHYGLLGELFKVNPSGVLPTLPIAGVLACAGFSYESARSKGSPSLLLVKWTLIASLAFNFFSTSEPQWLSWLVPIGILYGSLTKRLGLQYFSYVFGTVVTFLIVTLLQGTAYMLIGTSLAFRVAYVEGISGGVLLYATMTTIMMILFAAYLLLDRLRSFSLEIVPLIILIYLQLCFWIGIVGIGKFVGVS